MTPEEKKLVAKDLERLFAKATEGDDDYQPGTGWLPVSEIQSILYANNGGIFIDPQDIDGILIDMGVLREKFIRPNDPSKAMYCYYVLYRPLLGN